MAAESPQIIINSKAGRRLFAGIWFAIVAAIPVAFYFKFFGGDLPLFGPYNILIAILPILIAGFLGVFVGSPILDPAGTKSAARAALRGLAVSMLSYVLLIMISAGINTLPTLDIINIIGFFVGIFLYGLIFVGWLIALAGAIAGLLLYLIRVKLVKSYKLP